MAKLKLKPYEIDKRFLVWGTLTIKAESFDKAVEAGRELEYTDFAEACDKGGWNDIEEADGFGVRESWA